MNWPEMIYRIFHDFMWCVGTIIVAALFCGSLVDFEFTRTPKQPHLPETESQPKDKQ